MSKLDDHKIAALYIDEKGPYVGLPGVDAWGASRDARLYTGPWPVVAHPPCERWGRYATGGPSARVRRQKGDDGGCFAAALAAVRKWGGVLEHPAHSAAWEKFGLFTPPESGGWVNADFIGGWTCQVWQGHYGHKAAKATWLYACRVRDLPSLRWGPCVGVRLDEGFHSAEERARARCRSRADQEAHAERSPAYSNPLSRSARSDRRAREAGLRACEFLSTKQRARTPEPFRDLLLSIVEFVCRV